jgi:hypothetical protein
MKEHRSAVIVEIRGSYAAALTKGGEYIRVPNEEYALGQRISLPGTVRTAHKRARLTAFATAAAAFLLLFGGFTSYVTPVGVVSLDVNPSIEYTINCFDRVLNVYAVNDDASRILAGMDEQALRFCSVDEAVEKTILQLRESGYLTQGTENDVVLSASSYAYRHAERLAERLSARVGQQSDLTVYSVSVERNEVQNAHALGTSAGKLYLIERLGESIGEDEGFNPMDWVKTPVRDIIAEMEGEPGAMKNDHSAQGGAEQQPAGTPEQGGQPAQGNESKPGGGNGP